MVKISEDKKKSECPPDPIQFYVDPCLFYVELQSLTQQKQKVHTNFQLLFMLIKEYTVLNPIYFLACHFP